MRGWFICYHIIFNKIILLFIFVIHIYMTVMRIKLRALKHSFIITQKFRNSKK